MNATERLLAVVACQQVINRFYTDLDASDMDAVASSMNASGVWHRQGQALRGSEEVRQALAQRPEGRTTAHLVQNLVVDVKSATSARATYHTLVYRFDAQERTSTPVPLGAPLSISVHQDELVCDDTGTWSFLEKKSQRRFASQ